jgi:RecA-family ATPase
LYGPPKSYKSFVMLDMAACVGAGIQWAGNRTEQTKVLYVVAEGVRGIKRRVRAWEAQNKRTMVGVHFYERAVQLGDRKDVSTLIRTAKRGGYQFIILDTQARCTVGLEENSASEMGLVVAALDVLKEVTGACVALVHHSGAQGGRARGSTAILGALDAEFEVEADKRNMSVRMRTRAQKDLAEARDVELDLCTPEPGAALAVKARPQWHRPTAADLPPLSEKDKALLLALAQVSETGTTLAALAKTLGADVDTDEVRVAVNQLMRKGCVQMKGPLFFLDRVGALYVRVSDQQLPED